MTDDASAVPARFLSPPYNYASLRPGEARELHVERIEVGGMPFPPIPGFRFARPEGVRFHLDRRFHLGGPHYVDVCGAKLAASFAPLAGPQGRTSMRLTIRRDGAELPPAYSYTIWPA